MKSDYMLWLMQQHCGIRNMWYVWLLYYELILHTVSQDYESDCTGKDISFIHSQCMDACIVYCCLGRACTHPMHRLLLLKIKLKPFSLAMPIVPYEWYLWWSLNWFGILLFMWAYDIYVIWMWQYFVILVHHDL